MLTELLAAVPVIVSGHACFAWHNSSRLLLCGARVEKLSGVIINGLRAA
jgi:hypothetical protein